MCFRVGRGRDFLYALPRLGVGWVDGERSGVIRFFIH